MNGLYLCRHGLLHRRTGGDVYFTIEYLQSHHEHQQDSCEPLIPITDRTPLMPFPKAHLPILVTITACLEPHDD